MKEYTWHDIVQECERILGIEGTAESPLMSNLPNVVRDLKHRIIKPSASQPTSGADHETPVAVCDKCGMQHFSYMSAAKCCRSL